MRRAALACLAALAACGGGRVATPPPQTPIVAADDRPERPAAEVCGALIADLVAYQACVPDDRKDLIEAWVERAKIDFAALADETVSDADRRESARGCAKASGALRAALAACPTPPPSS
jgi:hypothetical protein